MSFLHLGTVQSDTCTAHTQLSALYSALAIKLQPHQWTFASVATQIVSHVFLNAVVEKMYT